MSKRVLYFVRHGQYENVTQAPDEPDGPLTEFGKEQAELLAERLMKLPVQFIHTSNYQRSLETAAILAARLPEAILRKSELLRECVPNIPPGYEIYFNHIPAEFIANSALQAQKAFEKYLSASGCGDEPEIVVTSGNMIKYLVTRMLNAPEDAWVHLRAFHCAITEIHISAEQGRCLVRYNDAGHLPMYLQLEN